MVQEDDRPEGHTSGDELQTVEELRARVAELERALERAEVRASASPATAERARQEEALRAQKEEAEARASEVEAILRCLTEGVLVYDAEGRITRANQAATEILGYTEAERLLPAWERMTRRGREWLDESGRHLDPRDTPVLRAANYGETHRGTRVRVRDASGERLLALSAGPLEVGGRRRGAVVSLSDRTEQERAERALRDERDFTHAVLDTTASLVLVLDREGRIVRFNRACELLSGYTEAEVLGSGWWILVPDRELGGVRPVFDALAAGQFPSEYENHWRTRDGRERLLAWSNTAMTDASGMVTFVVATGIDVTDRRATEDELGRTQQARRATEERFRAVFEQSAIGMGRVSFADARWIEVNDAFCTMLGYPRDELVGTPWPDITHPDDVELDLVPFRRMAAGELASYSVEKRFLHKDGHPIWARLTLSMVRDPRGRPDYEIAIIEDVGDRKRAELGLVRANEQLVDADRRKNEFMAMLSHELRNPLAPIRNSLHILGRVPAGAPQARRALEVIDRQSHQLERLVDDLLDVTRISRGKIQLQRRTLDLGELAHRTAEDHRSVYGAHGVALEVESPPAPIPVYGDPTRLAQVIGNLLANAVKFTPRGGRVVLSAARSGDWAELHVRDDGAGIEPHVAERLFEPFFQVGQTLDRSKGGLGLGLALVRGLAELHGGSARAASAGLGHGAEFVVRLPLDREALAGFEAHADPG